MADYLYLSSLIPKKDTIQLCQRWDISEALEIIKDKVSGDYTLQAIRKDLQEQLDKWKQEQE